MLSSVWFESVFATEKLQSCPRMALFRKQAAGEMWVVCARSIRHWSRVDALGLHKSSPLASHSVLTFQFGRFLGAALEW